MIEGASASWSRSYAWVVVCEVMSIEMNGEVMMEDWNEFGEVGGWQARA